MNEHVTKNKASATPPQATQASSPLLNQSSLTSEQSESVGSNSSISKELGGIQPKTVRRSLNWQNITVEAPSRGNGMSLPGGIQRQQEEPGAVSGERVSADSAQKSALELNNSTISTESSAQKSLIARTPFNGRDIPVEAPSQAKGAEVKDNKDESALDRKDSKVTQQEDPEHERRVKAGLAQIEVEQTRYVKNNDEIAKEDAEKVAAKVKAENPVFKSITVVDNNKETWDYIYVASPPANFPGLKQEKIELTEAEKRIALLLQEKSNYSKEDAEKRSKGFSQKISKLQDEIDKKSTVLFTFLESYLEYPKKIEEFNEAQHSERKDAEEILPKINKEFKNLGRRSGIRNVNYLSILIEILGSSDYLKYKSMYLEYEKRKAAYESQEQKAKNELQSKEPEALKNPVNKTQKSDKPMKILKEYGYHWDVARDVLAYGKKAQRNQMKTLVEFRSAVVIKVLQDVMTMVFNENICKKIPEADGAKFTTNSGGAELKFNVPIGEQSEKRKEEIVIEAIAPGSSSLTSDYDVTFRIVQLAEYEADLVEKFNQGFRNYFVSLGGPAYESGVVFDTNIYTSGIMGLEGALYKPKTTQANQELDQQQLAFSLVSVLKGLPQGEWENFQNQVTQEITKALPLKDNAVTIINNLFTEAKSHIDTTSRAVKEKKQEVMTNTSETLKIKNEGEESPSQEATSTSNEAIEIAAQMHAANRLYEEKIKNVSQLIKDYKEADKAYNPEAEDRDKQKKAEKIDDISLKLYKEQSLALIYANEAYYSAGPVLHIVGEMQIGLGKISTQLEYLQSLIMQIGYKLQHIQHYEHLFQNISNDRQKALKLDRVGLLFAKYGHRAVEALINLNKTFEELGVSFRLSHTTTLTIGADLDMEFIKKANQGTPQQNVANATKTGVKTSKNLKKGQNLDLDVMQSAWKELAIQTVAVIPALLNQQKSK